MGALWIIGPRGVDRTAGLVIGLGIWPREMLGAYALRSSNHMFAGVCMGYGLWVTMYEEPVAFRNLRTTGEGGCEGARVFVGLHNQTRRSNSIGFYL